MTLGRREPDLATLVRIAQTLQVSVDELLVDELQHPERPMRDRLLVAVEGLDDTDLNGLVIQAEALASHAAIAKTPPAA